MKKFQKSIASLLLIIGMILAYLIYAYYFDKKVDAPSIETSEELRSLTDFKGPTGDPYIQGPTSKPPAY